MSSNYLEQLHAEDIRRAEWRMLDESLRLRQARPGWLRRRLGRALKVWGANLAGERDAATS